MVVVIQYIQVFIYINNFIELPGESKVRYNGSINCNCKEVVSPMNYTVTCANLISQISSSFILEFRSILLLLFN